MKGKVEELKKPCDKFPPYLRSQSNPIPAKFWKLESKPLEEGTGSEERSIDLVLI